MTEESPDGDRAKLWRSLQLLSNDEGIWRPNLLELLRGDLSDLRRRWGINLNNGVDVARRTIAANLEAHINKLVPRDAKQKLTVGQRKRQYMHAVAISFNIIDRPELREEKLQDRREWLAKKERGPLQIAISTSQRDLKDAIGKIVDDLADGYEPTHLAEPEPVVATLFSTNSPIDPTLVAPIHQEPVKGDPLSPTGQSAPFGSSKNKLFGVVAMTVLVLAAASATLIVQPWQQPEPPSSPVIVNPAVAEPLIATVTSINSTADSISAVFPRGSNKSENFTKTIDESADLDLQKLLLDEMAAGAYSHGGAEVRMTVEGNADREVTITDIRPVNIERQPAATGELILGPTMGTGPPVPHRMGFILDRVRPDARVVNEDNSYGPAYFQLYTLGVSNRAKQALILEFTAQASAFSFQIQIDYEVGGQRFHHIVQKDGKPLRLRASADLCPGQKPNEVPEADQKFLEGAQYSGRSITRTDEAGMYVEHLNPVCNE